MNAKESAFDAELDEILRSISDGTGASVDTEDEDDDYELTELLWDAEDRELSLFDDVGDTDL